MLSSVRFKNILLLKNFKVACLLALLTGCFAATAKGVALHTAMGSNTCSDTLEIADPTIYLANGIYYLIGTSGDKTVGEGFKLYSSRDLKYWKRVKPSGNPDYLALDSSHSFGNKGFWAPQLLSTKGGKNKGKDQRMHPATFLLAYTANEQIAIAHADRVQGPFVQGNGKDRAAFAPLFKDGFKHIDPFIFTDPVSKKTYIYYVKLDHGNNIYVSELQRTGIPQSSAVPANMPYLVMAGSEKPCIKATENWENTANASWPVTEGPTVIYHKGFYYLFYSANDFRNPDYAVGYATSRSPVGPWIKAQSSPVISKENTGLPGSGHGDVFQDNKGGYYYVFHAHNSPEKVAPRKTYLIPFKFIDKQDAPALIQMDDQHIRPLLMAR